MAVRDNIHYKLNKIMSYKKAFMAVISEREAGKTTETWLFLYSQFKKGIKTILLRRRIADITEIYIQDIQKVLNKFDVDVKFEYKIGQLKDGIMDVFIDGELFFRVIALSNPMSRIKSCMVPDLGWIVFDEFICNTRCNEKYLADEAFIFKEMYNTYQREAENLRCIFLGNPYSLYNPYFSWWNIPTKDLKPGAIVVNGAAVVECYQILPELKAIILARNPLYQFDDSYKKYAFDGLAINDMNIRIKSFKPDNYRLMYIFRMDNKYITIYENNNHKDKYDNNNFYWIGLTDTIVGKRDVYCFDFSQLVDGTTLKSNTAEFRNKYKLLKIMIQNRAVQYENIEVSYMMEEIYKYI